jgi:hypothetical protein
MAANDIAMFDLYTLFQNNYNRFNSCTSYLLYRKIEHIYGIKRISIARSIAVNLRDDLYSDWP